MKKIYIIGAVITVMIVIIILFNNYDRVNITQNQGRIIFQYKEISVDKELADEDSKIISGFFNQKHLIKDEPSCGFTQSISVKYGDDFYCIACDGCGIVMVNEKYFKISEYERNKLHEILKKYGAVFPCV